MFEDANALVLTYGSCHLGVHGPGADISALCVGPSYVNREEDFFYMLHGILAEMEEITDLQPILGAHVPAMIGGDNPLMDTRVGLLLLHFVKSRRGKPGEITCCSWKGVGCDNIIKLDLSLESLSYLSCLKAGEIYSWWLLSC